MPTFAPIRAFAVLAMLSLLGGCAEEVASSHGTETSEEVESKSDATVRIVAANLTSGNNQSYAPGHGQRILRSLSADIALVQEFNVGDPSEEGLRKFVDETFGAEFEVFRETGASIPNGVVSRFPIADHGEWADPGSGGTRDFAWAKIDLPNARSLWAVSVHLKASGKSMDRRDLQANALVNEVKANVPADDFVVVGGDLNTESVEEPCIATLGQVFDVSAPYPADADGNTGTNTNRSKPYDWVLTNAAFRKYEVPVKLGARTFAGGFVLDTRTYPGIDELPPATREDSAAPSMQHMAVVKDFALPAEKGR